MTAASTPEELARKLSEEDRSKLLAGTWNIYPGVMRFIRLGLVEKLPGYYAQLTALGAEVREILKSRAGAL